MAHSFKKEAILRSITAEMPDNGTVLRDDLQHTTYTAPSWSLSLIRDILKAERPG